MRIPEDIELFEKLLAELIVKYEQYFLGLERREPLKLLSEVEKLSRKYQNSTITNTMQTFKYNTLKSRLVSYKQYWCRTNRLMEEGKYSRDRFKMDIHAKLQQSNPVGEKPAANSESEQLFREYIQARKECNLPVENITREMVADIVEKHKRAVMEKYRCNDVELRVTVENGNPRLKLRPKS
ncbi:MAG: MXAN_5187 C-terminal domain-containing protein [Deltaproteobacteria bacterium]